jgi:hypothetical protein
MSTVTPLRFVSCSRSAPPRGNSDGSEIRLAHGDEIAVNTAERSAFSLLPFANVHGNTVTATLLSAHLCYRRWLA